MEVVKLVAVFFVIVVALKFKGPLPLAIACGALATVLLFRLDAATAAATVVYSLTSWDTLSVLLIFYLITFIQRMMERRGDLMRAQHALNGIFNNRRINASLAPAFIGLLPSAGAVTICGAIVDSNCRDYLTAEEKTLVSSYFRHIPESFLPTYASVIIGVRLSGVPLPSFLVGMMPMVLVLSLIGYFYCLRKVPRDTGQPPSTDTRKDWIELGGSLWTIAAIVVLVIAFDVPVYAATFGVVVLNAIVRRFGPAELLRIVPSAFEARLLFSTAAIMVFKDVVAATGVISVLPAFFSQLPIPAYLVFFLIFFFGTIISGQQAITAICMPLAFATVPGAGMPLLVLLLSAGYIAMQISPTHICLAIVTEYFRTNMATLIRMTIPIVAAFCAVVIPYYLLLVHLGF